jgi:hypothetical protein
VQGKKEADNSDAANIKTLFEIFDADKDGHLNMTEYSSYCEATESKNCDEVRWKLHCKTLDVDTSGAPNAPAHASASACQHMPAPARVSICQHQHVSAYASTSQFRPAERTPGADRRRVEGVTRYANYRTAALIRSFKLTAS